MSFENPSNISELLSKPIWQMTGAEFCSLVRYANAQSAQQDDVSKRVQCHGMKELADFLGCSVSKIYTLKSSGVLDDAIISHIGKSIVFDGKKALELASGALA